MEEQRDEAIAKVMVKLQAACRRWLAWQERLRRLQQQEVCGLIGLILNGRVVFA